MTAVSLPSDDAALFELIRKSLYTPVVGDCLDNIGRYHQFLPPEIHGLDSSTVVVGRAMPVLIADVLGPQRAPFGRLTEALDQLDSGEVYIARNGGEVQTAAWGEILTATAKARGAAGAVIDGYHRDTPKVVEQNWPVFSRGRYAQDAGVRKSVLDFRVPIQIGGVTIAPGDLVFGDLDGVVVIPREVEREVLEAAIVKASGENEVRAAIDGGMSSGEAFAAFGIL